MQILPSAHHTRYRYDSYTMLRAVKGRSRRKSYGKAFLHGDCRHIMPTVCVKAWAEEITKVKVRISPRIDIRPRATPEYSSTSITLTQLHRHRNHHLTLGHLFFALPIHPVHLLHELLGICRIIYLGRSTEQIQPTTSTSVIENHVKQLHLSRSHTYGVW